MSTISVSQKLDISIKESTVNQKVFLLLFILLNLNLTPRTPTSPTVLFLIPKKPKLISDIISLLVTETAG